MVAPTVVTIEAIIAYGANLSIVRNGLLSSDTRKEAIRVQNDVGLL